MNQNLQYLIAICIGIIFTIPISFKMLVDTVKRGLKIIRGVKYRSRPEILTDKRFGKSSYLHLKEITMHYVEKGDTSKPLLLLVHGFPEFWFSWRHQLDSELADNFRVVAIDMRGYGETDKPSGIENYRIEKLVEDIRQAIQALGYEKCCLAGHDWGGAVSWAFAMTHPGMVEKLAILNCPHPAAFHASLRSNWAQFLKSWYMFLFQLPCYPEWYFSRQDLAFLEKALKGVVNQQELDAFKYTFSSPSAFNAPINYYRAAFRYPKPSLTSDQRQPLEVPAMMIFGANDLYIGEKTARLSSKYCRQLDFQLVPQASHWVQQDAPDQVNHLLSRFFADKPDEDNGGLGAGLSEAMRRGVGEALDAGDALKEDANRLLGGLTEEH